MNSVLFISLMNTNSWGGSEVQWLSLAECCLENNKSVTCLVYDWEDKKNILKKLINLGAKIIYIPNTGRKKKNIFERLRFEWVTRFEQRIFINKFNFSEYDYVVVNQGGFMDVTNHPWKNIYLKFNKYCLIFHNYTIDYQFKKNKAFILTKWMQYADKNFVASIKIKSFLEQQLNSTFTNFQSFINPITIVKSTNVTPFHNLDMGSYKLIMLAQLDIFRKAQDNLIQAFALPQWKERNVIIELYGGGEHFDLLEKMIFKNDLTSKVFLKGITNNVSEVLDSAHLVLQITHRDAMPISVVEAMSKSRAVIVSDVGDMPLWVNEGENGWIAPDASVQSITDVLEKAWEKRNDWEQMGVNAFYTFLKKYPTSVDEEFYQIISQ